DEEKEDLGMGEEGAGDDLDLDGMDDLGLEDDDMGGDHVMDKLEEILSEVKEIKGDMGGVEDDFNSFSGPEALDATTALAKAKETIKSAMVAVEQAKEDEKKGFPF